MSKSPAAKRLRVYHSLSALALVSLFAGAAFADPTQLCVPPGYGVPGRGGPPEWISGSAPDTNIDDPRWRGATSQSYGPGGSAHSRLRALQSGNNLYLSFQVMVDAEASQNPEDSVYVALAQTAGGTHHLLRLQLTATSNTKASTSGVAVSHMTWNGSAWAAAAPPTWLSDAAAWLTIDPTDGSPEWAINLKVDYATLGLSAPFKFWSGTAVQLTGAPVVTYASYVWPTGTLGPWSGGNGGALDQDIQAADWGDIKIGTSACSTGVSLTANNIGVLNGSTLGSDISTTLGNTFAAHPTYTGVTAAASKVKGRFRIANWGSSNEWTDIGPEYNSVAADSSTGVIEKACVQGGTPACPVPPAGHNHQCMLVELSSTSNTTFLNDSVARNMDFVSNSFFERDAEISLKGVKPLPGSRGKRDVYLYVDTKNMPKQTRGPLDEKALRSALQAAAEYDQHVVNLVDPKQVMAGKGDALKVAAGNPGVRAPAGGVKAPVGKPGEKVPVAELPPAGRQAPLPVITSSKTPHEILKSVWPTYEVHVYYDSGKEMKVGNAKGLRLTPAPSFGFFVHHAGDLSGWLHDMVGLDAKLVEIAPHFYKVEVPDNGTIKLVNRIEGVMPGREPTLPQIGKGGGGGPVVQPPPGPGPGGHCPKVEPGPHGCACTVVGASQRDAGFAGLALASLLGLVLRRRARRVS
jgi:hypothetical protein